ncbi:MAG TPA: hypothetical protein VM537_15350 [Anaerolineae bacterium]|nr:hypothetical protein [Anaerolineae bacterium]
MITDEKDVFGTRPCTCGSHGHLHSALGADGKSMSWVRCTNVACKYRDGPKMPNEELAVRFWNMERHQEALKNGYE